MAASSQQEGSAPAKRSVIDWGIRFCLENKLIIWLFVLFIAGWGLMTAPFDLDLGGLPRDPVPVDAIPDIGENQQIVFTKWPGRSPQDVEDQITYPMTVSLLGVPGIKTVRSISMFGFSLVYVIFKDDVEFYWSRTRVLEKLNSLPAGTLPEGVSPVLGPDATALGQVFWYTLEGLDPDGHPVGGWDLGELRSIQDWYVRYGLLAAEGVAEVASVGGYVQEYQVNVDPDAMRAYDVSLEEVFHAVRMANVDVGARTIEINSVEYVIRGLGLVKSLSDIETAVVKVNDNVPIFVKNVAEVALGPALRRGALDKAGTEAVGGVVVVRYGENPLAAIKNVKKKIAELAPGLPEKILADGTVSKLTIVPFYDRSDLIYETLGTLGDALLQQILVTIIVVVVMVRHLRSSILISGLLPLAVLMCFIGMRTFGVDANIVALSGIAIAIGTIVDMGVIVCENILRHLDEAPESEDRLDVICRAASEVGGAVLTAVSTTIVSFLPVFTMEAAEGKLFQPLAYTKTFALIASVLIALTVIPPAAHMLFTRSSDNRTLTRRLFYFGLVLAGITLMLWLGWFLAGSLLVLIGGYQLLAPALPGWFNRWTPSLANGAVVLAVVYLLTQLWLPIGPEKGMVRNLIIVVGSLGGLLVAFQVFQWAYPHLLRWSLNNKPIFLLVPFTIVAGGLFVWLGPAFIFGPLAEVNKSAFRDTEEIKLLVNDGLILEPKPGVFVWSRQSLTQDWTAVKKILEKLAVSEPEAVRQTWSRAQNLNELKQAKWDDPDDPQASAMHYPLARKVVWTVVQGWNGLDKEFMPPLDEGSYLYMPNTMHHAGIGEVLDVLQKQDIAFDSIPEVELAVGKLGRVESPLDPAPISMIETVINYFPKYLQDRDGHRLTFRFDPGQTDFFRNRSGDPVPAPDGLPYTVAGKFIRNDDGHLIPDDDGYPFPQWRPALDPALSDENTGRPEWRGIVAPDRRYYNPSGGKWPETIWDAIVDAGKIPGTTSAPNLQPIATRLVMLQSGMRAPMGVKIKGPSLEAIEDAGFQIEKLLKEVPSVHADAVVADRPIGKPYLEIEIDREAIARYGIKIRHVQDVIEVAIGGRTVTTTIEGRERYPVRVRYMRELRDTTEALGRILVPAPDGTQIPLEQLSTTNYVRGPQAIKSEDTFLVGYVLFDKMPGRAEVAVVEEAKAYLQSKLDSGEFKLPAGVSYTFSGSYENQVRAEKKLMVVLPMALFLIFMILYLHFRSTITTGLVFSGIVVAWAGGFLMIWCYAQPWFLDVNIMGVNLRELFQVHPINLSVAIWVGFLALFGIATDDGVVVATYLRDSFKNAKPTTVAAIREATILAGKRRIRPCLMTTATTLLALLPVLTSKGRGSDIMVPMAIPSFGGMAIEVITMLVVPVLYCGVEEMRLKFRRVA